MDIPVVTIDGPSGVGKGTISMALSKRLGWHFLDSGALYRLLGLAASRHALDFDNAEAIITLAAYLDVQFRPADEPGQEGQMLLEGEDVADLIRTEEAGNNASKVAAIPAVREALLGRQRDFLKEPGLVADGRDMGTVVFPEAKLKIFMTASAEERAKRRYKQLIDKGLDANLSGLLAEIEARDKRDRERPVSPLKPADDAILIDTTELSIDEVIERVTTLCQQRGLII